MQLLTAAIVQGVQKEGQKVKVYCVPKKGIFGAIKGFLLTQIY